MFKGMPALQEANIRQLGLDGEDYGGHVSWTVLASPRAPLRIEGRGKMYESLLDSEAEVNLISEETQKRHGLAMRTDVPMTIRAHGGGASDILGICQDIALEFPGGAVVRQSFVVSREADNPVLLRQLFLATTNFEWLRRDDR